MHMKLDTDGKDFFSQAWAFMFKVNNVLLPFFVAWAVWVTSEIYELRAFKGQGPRFTETDAKNLALNVKQWTNDNFMSISSKNELVSEIKLLKDTISELRDTVIELKVSFREATRKK